MKKTVALGIALVASATWATPPPINLSALAGADRVRITRNDGAVMDISDRAQIDAFYHLISGQPNKWHRITFDAPRVSYSVEFFHDAKDLGGYAVGQNFLELWPYALTLKPDQEHLAMQLEGNIFATEH